MATVAGPAIVIAGATLLVSIPVGASPETIEHESKNRSGFQYHDGHAEERRPYRRPNLDADPTNLMFEELRGRINSLEERLEQLEYKIQRSTEAR